MVAAPRLLIERDRALALVTGHTFAIVGLGYLSRMPVDAEYWVDLFPGLLRRAERTVTALPPQPLPEPALADA
jgi:hypothetical protein